PADPPLVPVPSVALPAPPMPLPLATGPPVPWPPVPFVPLGAPLPALQAAMLTYTTALPRRERQTSRNLMARPPPRSDAGRTPIDAGCGRTRDMGGKVVYADSIPSRLAPPAACAA